MKPYQCLELIRSSGVIAILRLKNAEGNATAGANALLSAAEAIRAGGIRAIEVTLNTPGALALIEKASAHFDGSIRNDHCVAFGAGTVLDASSARAAILAGAQFIVAPTLKAEVIELCRRYSVPVFPGAYTPTEILTAWELGADMVKVFPASIGGPAFIKAIKAPLQQIELIPVGGVTLENTADFLRAGASAVGVGGELLDPQLIQSEAWPALTERARRFAQAAQRT